MEAHKSFLLYFRLVSGSIIGWDGGCLSIEICRACSVVVVRYCSPWTEKKKKCKSANYPLFAFYSLYLEKKTDSDYTTHLDTHDK